MAVLGYLMAAPKVAEHSSDARFDDVRDHRRRTSMEEGLRTEYLGIATWASLDRCLVRYAQGCWLGVGVCREPRPETYHPNARVATPRSARWREHSPSPRRASNRSKLARVL